MRLRKSMISYSKYESWDGNCSRVPAEFDDGATTQLAANLTCIEWQIRFGPAIAVPVAHCMTRECSHRHIDYSDPIVARIVGGVFSRIGRPPRSIATMRERRDRLATRHVAFQREERRTRTATAMATLQEDDDARSLKHLAWLQTERPELAGVRYFPSKTNASSKSSDCSAATSRLALPGQDRRAAPNSRIRRGRVHHPSPMIRTRRQDQRRDRSRPRRQERLTPTGTTLLWTGIMHRIETEAIGGSDSNPRARSTLRPELSETPQAARQHRSRSDQRQIPRTRFWHSRPPTTPCVRTLS